MRNYSIVDLKRKKKKLVDNILLQLKSTKDFNRMNKLALFFLGNFRDPRFVPTLMKISNSKDFAKANGTLIYVCGEYSNNECKKYLKQLVNWVINGDYESAWSSAQIIIEFKEPYPWPDKLLNELHSSLELALENKSNNKEFIKAVLKKFENS